MEIGDDIVYVSMSEFYDALLTLMSHDKKSENGEMNFTLLSDVGEVKINCCASDDDVRAALDIYRDLMHI